MNIYLGENGEVRMDEIDEFAAMILRELPSAASPADEQSESRIYQSPTNGKDEEIDEDWKDIVEPELRELFAEAMDLVIDDLAKMKPNQKDILAVEIPPNHIDAWIHTLNRARLVLGTKWNVTEDDMESGYSTEDGNPERSMAIFKIEFYGMFLEFLVRIKCDE
jgi:hypothetical protein